jgi:hypothetical protein
MAGAAGTAATDGAGSTVVVPDLFSVRGMESASANFTRYVAATSPRAVVIVIGTSSASIVSDIFARLSSPSTDLVVLRGGLQWAHRVTAGRTASCESGGILLASSDWQVVALDPRGDARYVGSQAIRLARLLGSNVICAGSPSPSLIHETIEGDGGSADLWALELGTAVSDQVPRNVAFAVLPAGGGAEAPKMVVIPADGSFTVDGVEYR